MKNIIKRAIAAVICGVLVLSLAACGGGGGEKLSIQSIAATDLWELQLNRVDYGTKLNAAINSEDKFLPNEKGSTISSKGHSFITVSYTIKNLDRTGHKIPSFNQEIKYKTATVKPSLNGSSNYDSNPAYYGTIYIPNGTLVPGTTVNRTDAAKGYGDDSELSGEKTRLGRFYVDIPFEESLSENVEIYFSLPDLNGKITKFTYTINPNEMNLSN